MESRTLNAKRNMIASLFGKIVSLFLPFVTRTVFIYSLGSLYLGLNSIFSSVLSVLSLAELGVGTAMVYSMYKPIADGDTEAVCALLNLYRKFYRVIGAVILALGLAFTPFLPHIIEGDVPADVNLYILYFINLSSTVVSYFLFAYKSSILSASQRMDIISYINTAISIALSIAQVIVLLLFKNYYAYCILLPITNILENLVRSVVVDKLYPQYRCHGTVGNDTKNAIKKHVSGLFIYKLCGVLRSSVDSVIISASLGLMLLARYNNYYYVMTTITGLLSIIVNSIIAGVGNSIVTETQEKNYKDFNKMQLLYMWLSGFCAVALLCLYQPFMKLWVGEELMFDNATMTVFCIYFFISHWGNMCYAYREAAGLWWQDRITPIIEGVVNLVISVILVRTIGVCGVLIGSIIGLAVFNSYWYSRTLFKYYFTDYKQSRYLGRLLFYTAITAVAAVATAALCQLLPVVEWTALGIVSFLLRGILCLIVPNILFFICYRTLPEFSDATQMVKNILQSKIRK